jgi:transcriptional regulator with AAA-type ATPase domain
MTDLFALRRSLRDATTFADAAGVLIEHGKASLEEALEGAAIARGLVHLRTETRGYVAVLARDWSKAPSGAAQVAPSASAFALVERERAGVSIDVRAVRGERLGDGAALEVARFLPVGDPRASVHQVIARGATHVIALPLIGATGDVVGMATFELVWPEHIGRPLPPGPYRTALDLACDLATPRLVALSLPSEGAPSEAVDPLLPVVGARMQSLLAMLRVFVDQDETLLISGPTGAGKSRLAAWCHARSSRSGKPFETANLLALPDNLQLAELFGWKKGAFTGANADHEGLVAAADGGTLFLDEIDKLSLNAQAGLLRFLETRLYLPLGAPKEKSANVRIVVGTNADLRALVKSGAFREDLYYRVHVLPVHLPPLSERRDEVEGWARFMIARRHEEAGRTGQARLDDAAVARLIGYGWPGNLRQLDNVMRRAYALALGDRGLGSEVRVGDAHVQKALLPEEESKGHGTSPSSLEEHLFAAAERLVDSAIAARREGRTLPLAELEGLRGAVLKVAADRLGSVKDAFLLLGGEGLVQSRNHQREYKREVAALEALLARTS